MTVSIDPTATARSTVWIASKLQARSRCAVSVASSMRARTARTRSAALEVAERLFDSRGYAGTRLEDVAASAGVSPAAILYHFGDKSGLYREVVDASYGPVAEAIRRTLVGAGSFPERIERAIGAAVDLAGTNPAWPRSRSARSRRPTKPLATSFAGTSFRSST